MQKYGRVRRRDGASQWGEFRDVEHAELYLKTFLVISWAEHLRQHEGLTRGDAELEQRLRSYVAVSQSCGILFMANPGSEAGLPCIWSMPVRYSYMLQFIQTERK